MEHLNLGIERRDLGVAAGAREQGVDSGRRWMLREYVRARDAIFNVAFSDHSYIPIHVVCVRELET